MSVICKKCGLIDDYRVEIKSNNNCAYCKGCNSFIKNIPKNDPLDIIIYFGKYKGYKIREVTDRQYLQWVVDNFEDLKERYKDPIKQQLKLL